MKIISVEGIVINVTPFKESSKILNILTKEYGIIGVVSKGCKGIKSKLRLVSERNAYAIFHMYYKENGLSTLIDGDIINYFINIRKDIIKTSYMSYLIELASSVFKQSNNEEVYDLLINSLLKIEEGFDHRIISNILELQYLDYLGIGLNLDCCVRCGESKVVTLSLSKGGYVCSIHRTDEVILNEKTIKMFRLYKYVDISKISELKIDKNVSNKINDILDEYYKEYSGIYTKNKDFLKSIDN